MENQQVLDEILRRVDQAGGRLVTPVKALAAELGLKPQRLYYLIGRFEADGRLSTISRGPNGTELRQGSGRPAPDTGERRGVRGRPAAAARRVRAGGRGAGRFCPMCGQRAQAEWKYCAACGQRLPGR